MGKSVNIPPCAECKNKNSIFCSLSIAEKDNLSTNKVSNFYKKGQVIFYEGNQSHGLFCIYEGKVKLSKLGSDGKDQVVRFTKTGEVLGYRSLFSGEPYQATATVLEDSYICHLRKDKFMDSVNGNPKLSLEIIKLLSSNLKNAERHLLNIAQKTATERIASALLLMQSIFGFKPDGKTLDIVLTRSEIADIAATTSETTIRTLKKLSKEGKLVLNGKKIVIPDLNVLKKVAGYL